MKFTIDTETDAYEKAIRTVQAAYHRRGEALPAVLQGPSGEFEPVVWEAPGWDRYASWTEPMLRAWTVSLRDVDCLNYVWRVCAEPGPPGVHTPVLAEYITCGMTGKQAISEMTQITRRLNRAAREFCVDGPLIVKESTRRRVADPAVAAIVMDELTRHPLWPQMRHHTHPPKLNDRPATR
ncbi:hypothetical protein ACMATS_38055 (plasmid) [Streptoverticillium reticulum]|uniref:hypothetical protein n=1 Tax=Streptoverticillium reticulum TaxID=1433415 RepID=UPI0039BF1B90